MPNKYSNLLVPVHFTARDKWAISKAVELANTFDCHIHLVHVVPPSLFSFSSPYNAAASIYNAGKKLEALRAHYRPHLCGKGAIEISVLQGSHIKALSRYIREYSMDLVVTGLRRYNTLAGSIAASWLARKTFIPVLAVRSNGLVNHFKKIVLPLSDDISMHRIKMATMLARSFRSTVYLVSLQDKANTAEKLLDTALQVVQSLSTVPVQVFLLEGRNLAKSTIRFSKRINADLIMVSSPLKELSVRGLFKRLKAKLSGYHSRIPVMTIEQNNEATSL